MLIDKESVKFNPVPIHADTSFACLFLPEAFFSTHPFSISTVTQYLEQ